MSLRYHYPSGSISVQGFYFDQSLAKNDIQTRILTLWTDSSRLYQIDSGYILIDKEDRKVFVDACLGSPLIKQIGGYSNVLLLDQEEHALNISSSVLLLLRHGCVESINLSAELAIDPSIWLNLDAYQEQQVHTLGVVKVPQAKAKQIKKTVREALNDSGLDESKALKGVLKNLDKLKKGDKTSFKSDGLFTKGGALGFAGLLNAIKTGVSSAFSFSKKTVGVTENKYQSLPDLANRSGFLDKIRNAFSQYLMKSALGKALGKAQAKHVEKLMSELKAGNLDFALRNALPLGNLQDVLQSKHVSMRFKSGALPQSINPYAPASANSFGMEENLIRVLEKMYEKMFEQLDKAGNYKKAAFVLAELLRDIDRAVAYLEKHKQYVLAAELAEGQKLEPARIVRQWILANKIEKAMQVAIISGCYLEAITALEQDHIEHANKLRWRFAELHYMAGNNSLAVDIAWPLEIERPQVIMWLKESVELGGEVGARHLVRLANHDPENYDIYLCKIDELLRSEYSQTSLAMLDEVISFGNSQANKRIASLAARNYLIEIAKSNLHFDRFRWNRLCVIAGDLTLRADVRGLDFQLTQEKTKLSAGDAQKRKIFQFAHGRHAEDFALLLNGKILIAFGESGVELRSANGKVLERYAVPCNKIVISDDKNKALLIATRSGYQVIHQYDLKTQVADYWMDLDIDRWAASYDGNAWIVGRKDSVFVLDVLSTSKNVLWSVSQLPGWVTSINRCINSFAVSLAAEDKFEVWVYRLPNLYLKERAPHSQNKLGNFEPLAINQTGNIVGLNSEKPDEFGIYRDSQEIKWCSLENAADIKNINFYNNNMYVFSSRESDESVDYFSVVDGQNLTHELSFTFEGDGDISIRSQADYLLIHHSMGRIVTIDLTTEKIMSDFIV